MNFKSRSLGEVDKRGAVVLLDALGSKTRWKKIGDIGEQLQWFNQWNELLNLTELVTREEFGSFEVKIKSFSDTVLLTFSHVKNNFDFYKSELDADYALLSIASSYAGFFSSCALSMNILFRGGISYGYFLEDEYSIMGDALIDVASYFELPNWIGISLTPSAHKIVNLKKLSGVTIKGNLVNYDVPLKIGTEKDGIVLNMLSDYLRTKQSISEFDGPYRKYAVTNKMDFSTSIDMMFTNMLLETNNIEYTVKLRNTLSYLKFLESMKK